MTWMQSVRARLKHEPLYVEIFSGVSMILWAIISFSSHTEMAGRAMYALLSQAMSDEQWQALTFCLGFMQIAFVAIDMDAQGLRYRRLFRWVTAGIMSAAWFFMGLAVYVSAPGIPGVALYLGQGLANLTAVALLVRSPTMMAHHAARN